MIIPPKLCAWDEIRVIAPSRSLSLIGQTRMKLAQTRFESEGFRVTYGKHVWEMDEFQSSSIESRITDLHDAFSDPNVKAIFSVVGGFNSNQLLDYIDYDLIRNNPKIFCGFSDITAIATTITSQTGLVTYSGPHFSTWAMQKEFDYNLEYFRKCLMEDAPFEIEHSKSWSDDMWFMDQENREIMPDSGYWTIYEWKAEWRIIGGHIRCISSLQGTKYMPSLGGNILFLEEDCETNAVLFDRLLQSLIHQPDFSGVRAILIGRFQKSSNITREILTKIIETKKELAHIPVIANVDFGHTNPLITFPIGGSVRVSADENGVNITILEH